MDSKAFTLVGITVLQEFLLFLILAMYGTKDLSVGVDFFCETVSNQTLFVQQANAWSSVSYIVIAWSITLYLAIDTVPLRDYQCLAPFLISCVGLGSIAFHGLVHLWGGMVDYIALILYLCYELSVSALGDNRRQRTWWATLSSVALVVTYLSTPAKYDAHYGVHMPTDVGTVSLIVVAVLISLFVVINLVRLWQRPHLGYLWLLFGGVSLLAGFAFWIAFQDGCQPDMEGIHGHAAWHVLTSFAMGAVFMFRESNVI